MKNRFFGAAGILLIAAAVLISNTAIEQGFGRAPHSLGWGPALFRVMLAVHGIALMLAALARPGAPEKPRWPIRRQSLAALGVLTAIAIALRIPGLNSCMWLDEVLTMVRFAKPPATQILTSFPDQNQHMFYSLLAHASVSAFGAQVWALRLPSVVLGVAAIWAVFLLGRKLFGDYEALLACALMTLSYHHIWFSQNARGYMGLMFFTTFTTWLWLEAMERDSRRTWMGYAVAVTLGLWIHITMLFVVGSHALIFLFVWLRSGRKPEALRNAAAAFFLCGSMTLQVYALSMPEFLRSAAGEVSMPSEWTNPLWVVKESIRNLQTGFAAAAVVLAGGFLVAGGWLDILRIKARAAWAFVLPAVVGGGFMLAVGHNLWPRFFFFCMGFGLLIVVHGAVLLPRTIAALMPGLSPGQGWNAGYALAGLLILASASTVPRCYALPKQDYTGARDFVEKQQEPGDAVIAVGLAGHVYGQYYAPQWPVAHSPEELEAMRAGHPRSFVVYTLPIELKAFHPALWKAVQEGYEPVKVFYGSLGGGEVYVCREKAATLAAR